jgi:3D (Asp-Asp-Asp) domain-containing protein
MKNIIVLILATLLVFGCMGGTPAAKPVGKTTPANATANTTSQQTTADACTPVYTFSELPAGILSKQVNFVATATCAAGKRLVVKLDGAEAASTTVSGNGTLPLEFAIAPGKDGTVKLTVESDGVTVHSRDWEVAPLGSAGTMGVEYDAVSFKEWRAMAVDVGSQITAGKIKIFMKRLQWKTQPATVIVVEIRKNDNGKPGDRLAGVERPINVTTLSDNWIAFDIGNATLAPGRYWITMKIKQTEEVSLVSDVIQVHYVPVDKQVPGNGYTRQMMLSVDEKKGVASETQWTPLAYDRVYSITLHGG